MRTKEIINAQGQRVVKTFYNTKHPLYVEVFEGDKMVKRVSYDYYGGIKEVFICAESKTYRTSPSEYEPAEIVSSEEIEELAKY